MQSVGELSHKTHTHNNNTIKTGMMGTLHVCVWVCLLACFSTQSVGELSHKIHTHNSNNNNNKHDEHTYLCVCVCVCLLACFSTQSVGELPHVFLSVRTLTTITSMMSTRTCVCVLAFSRSLWGSCLTIFPPSPVLFLKTQRYVCKQKKWFRSWKRIGTCKQKEWHAADEGHSPHSSLGE
jgi:hypothetical protein